jgi:hypothetical protein
MVRFGYDVGPICNARQSTLQHGTTWDMDVGRLHAARTSEIHNWRHPALIVRHGATVAVQFYIIIGRNVVTANSVN